MIRAIKAPAGAISRGLKFFTKQDRDWKITVARTNSAMFLYRLVSPYISIYTMALGASGTQLGIVNSAGMAIGGILGPLVGWLIDKIGVKQIYLIGITILAVSYLIYGLAQSWPIIIVAMLTYWMGNQPSMLSCGVICANCLKSGERASGMAVCETFGMGLLGFVAPMVGAWLVTRFGGLNVEGIRPLFIICMGGVAITFFLVLTQLSNRGWGTTSRASLSFFQGFSQVFKEGQNLKRWLIIASLTGMEMGMVTPYVQPFAHQFKGADQFVLGAMVTASAVAPMVLGIPFGRLADRIGRKKVIYLIMPFVWTSYLMLIFAPNSGILKSVFLIASGVLQGFFMVTGVVTNAMSRELVPPEQMGRWTGIIGLFRMGLGAITVYLAGIIWDKIGPQYVFVTIIALDLLRIPLLLGMPETLSSRAKSK